MPPEAMAGMDADMMGACPPEAMAGAYGDMMAAMPPEAIAGMDMSMLTQIPVEAVGEVDWANVPPEAMDAGIAAFKEALEMVLARRSFRDRRTGSGSFYATRHGRYEC